MEIRWQPLSSRQSGASPDPPYDGVPGHLAEPLRRWFVVACRDSGAEPLDRLGLRMRVGWESNNTSAATRADDFLAVLTTQRGSEGMLDAVDGLLWLLAEPAARVAKQVQEQAHPPESFASDVRTWADQVTRLERVLEDGGSVWRLNAEFSGLEQRVSDASRAAYEEAAATASTHQASAADHLKSAWRAAYGREPDPSKAYSEAIKAVEAAAAPIVTPNDLRATLGTIRGELRKFKEQFSFAISPGQVDAVINAITTLYEGQTDRHGGTRLTTPITPPAALAAVQLAVTLVHWFSSEAVARR